MPQWRVHWLWPKAAETALDQRVFLWLGRFNCYLPRLVGTEANLALSFST